MKRCEWCLGHEIYKKYHDLEWGVPSYDDRTLFEMLILEGAQAGLSWITVLKKRDNYRQAFDNFDAEKMANYDQIKIDTLLQNKGIIRNKLKINASVTNARAYLKILDTYPSFKDYIWSFVDGTPILNAAKQMSDIPATSAQSDRMSKQLKKDGFKFVGSTIIYAYMQSMGMVNDHLVDCFRYQQIIDHY